MARFASQAIGGRHDGLLIVREVAPQEGDEYVCRCKQTCHHYKFVWGKGWMYQYATRRHRGRPFHPAT